MNASRRFKALRETAQVQEYHANLSAHTVLLEHRWNRQTAPRNQGGPEVPVEGTFETFIDGAGI
jgi:hypothetical protein